MSEQQGSTLQTGTFIMEKPEITVIHAWLTKDDLINLLKGSGQPPDRFTWDEDHLRTLSLPELLGMYRVSNPNKKEQ